MILMKTTPHRRCGVQSAAVVLTAGLLLLSAGTCTCPAQEARRWYSDVVDDHRHHYDWPNLLYMAAASAGASLMLVWDVDDEFQEWYQREVRAEQTDDMASLVEPIGRIEYIVPVFAASACFRAICNEDTPILGVVGEWGLRSLRATAVGAPTVALLQRVLGTYRPDSGGDGEWRFWEKETGVSGHVFLSCTGFLTAADLCESDDAAAAWCFVSFLPVISRVNDEKHYLSQALIGWFLAWRSVRSVSKTEDVYRSRWAWEIVPRQEGLAVHLVTTF